jgi:hypothetical protein
MNTLSYTIEDILANIKSERYSIGFLESKLQEFKEEIETQTNKGHWRNFLPLRVTNNNNVAKAKNRYKSSLKNKKNMDRKLYDKFAEAITRLKINRNHARTQANTRGRLKTRKLRH